MKSTKKQLGLSFLSLLLCVSMLLGTTYAWFTDSVTSGKNHIIAGNLDVEMYWSNDLSDWHDVEDPEYSAIFDYDLWEPGYTELRYIKVVNAGNLAMKYDINMLPNGTLGKLADVIDVYYIDEPLEPIVSRTAIKDMSPSGVLSDVIGNVPVVTGTLGREETNTFGVVLKMQESAGNEYQNESVGEDGFSVILRATQLDAELDSFGDDYDAGAVLPAIIARDTKTVSVTDDQTVAEELLLGGRSDDNASAVVQVGVALAEGVTQLTFTVDPVEKSKANVRSSDELTRISLDVHVEGIAEGNTVPVIVTLDKYLPKNLNSTSVKLFHVENGETNEMTHVATAEELTAHNRFTYDSATGDIKMALCSFSEILITADESDPWNGTVGTMPAEVDGVYTINTAEELAAFAKAVNDGDDFSDKTVKLGKNIVLNDWKVDDSHDYTAKQLGDYNDPAFEQNEKLFHKFTPIGKGSNLSNETAANDLKPFRGTFDGCGYAISGLFNLWYDDPAEWSAQIGLFGCVENATIRNLTIRDSFIYTYGGMVGLVASFAGGNSTFENITIQDNFCTAYNNYLGGVVGCVFDHDGTNAKVTFNNCYVDNSNLFKALWETYDAPIGGICGGAYANSDVTFKDCTVFPEMSLYNDCCANYQWFAYRYSGMLIGYVRAGDRANYLANKVNCERVTVKYGEWTDQYYCELVGAGKGSYNEPNEYKYRRIDKDQLKYDEDGKICGCDEAKTGHNHAAHPEEDHIAENITFHQLFGGGQGVYGEETHSGVTLVDDRTALTIKLPHTADYLYRVGNQNTVTLGTLFKNDNGATIPSSAIKLTAEKVIGVTSVEYIVDSGKWEDSTLKFSGAGVIRLTLKYPGQEEPVNLNLEVIDAWNATSAVSSDTKNVVLLSDISTSSQIYVKNGYTFYGNGFKVTYSGNGSRNSSSGMNEGVFTITNGGVLDNVSVICKIFPRAYMYVGQTNYDYYLKEPSNTDDNGSHYNYQWSGIYIAGDNSKVLNSYIFGARNNILVGAGDVTIDNCTCSCGALSNINISSQEGSTVTLKDVTTIQYLNSDGFNRGVNTMGFGILVGGDGVDSNPTLVIDGYLNQYNWVNGEENITSSKIAPKLLKAAIAETAYQHTYNGKKYVNLGIIFYNNAGTEIVDNRTCKNDYQLGRVSISAGIASITGQVYSVKANMGTVEFKDSTYEYTPGASAVYTPVSRYKNLEMTEPDAERFIYLNDSNTIQIQFPKGESYEMDIMNYVSFDRYTDFEKNLTVTCGGAMVNGTHLTFTEAGTYDVTFTAEGEPIYDKDGKLVISNGTYKHTISINVKTPDISRKDAEISVTPLNTTGVKINSSGDRYFWFDIFDGLTITDYDEKGNPLKLFDGAGNSTATKMIAKIVPGGSTDLLNGSANYGAVSTVTITFNDGRELILSMVRTNCSNSPGGTKAAYLKTDSSKNSLYYVTNSAAGSSGVKTKLNNSTFACQYKINGYKFTGFSGKQVTTADEHVASCGLYNGTYTTPSTGTKPTTSFTPTKTLIYNANGGSVEPAYATGSNATLPTPTREGYRCIGWNTARDGSGTSYAVGASFTIRDTVTLYAQWAKLVNYTVTFNGNGGTVSPTSSKQYGKTDIKLPTPESALNWFVGWTENEDGSGTKYAAGATYNTPEKDVTLYAQWSPKYYVIFDPSGGSVTAHYQYEGYQADIYEGKALTLPTPTTTDPSEAFVGWYIGDTQVTSPYTPTANVTLTAKWNTKVTVSYSANGGDTTPASQTIGQGASITLATAPTKTGYTFKGWSDGTTTYSAGASYTVNANVTMIAQWTVNSYNIKASSLSNASFTVKYNGNTEVISNTSTTVSVPYGTSVTITVSYTESSSQSCTIKSGNSTYTSGTAFNMPAANVELTASSESSCILPGTLITMADGTQKPVEEIVAGDMLLTWDLTTGDYGKKPVVFNDHTEQPEEWIDVIYVTFSDGTNIGIVYEHGFFDMDLGKYVYLDENAAQYIGHAFIKEDGSTVTLTDVEIKHEYTKYYSPTTFGDLCYYTDGMLSMPGGISGLFNIFDVDTDTMKYDEAKMQANIETYGLLDIDAFGGMIAEDMFNAFNGKYLGIAVGKGNLTWEYIAYLAERYAPLCK